MAHRNLSLEIFGDEIRGSTEGGTLPEKKI